MCQETSQKTGYDVVVRRPSQIYNAQLWNRIEDTSSRVLQASMHKLERSEQARCTCAVNVAKRFRQTTQTHC